jgi:uncharacterized protein YukE
MERKTMQEMGELINHLEATAKSLKEKAQGMQSVERNVVRIMASVAMLKINVNDVYELEA